MLVSIFDFVIEHKILSIFIVIVIYTVVDLLRQAIFGESEKQANKRIKKERKEAEKNRIGVEKRYQSVKKSFIKKIGLIEEDFLPRLAFPFKYSFEDAGKEYYKIKYIFSDTVFVTKKGIFVVNLRNSIGHDGQQDDCTQLEFNVSESLKHGVNKTIINSINGVLKNKYPVYHIRVIDIGKVHSSFVPAYLGGEKKAVSIFDRLEGDEHFVIVLYKYLKKLKKTLSNLSDILSDEDVKYIKSELGKYEATESMLRNETDPYYEEEWYEENAINESLTTIESNRFNNMSLEEAKTLYRKLMKKYHPDNATTGDEKEATQIQLEYDEYVKFIEA